MWGSSHNPQNPWAGGRPYIQIHGILIQMYGSESCLKQNKHKQQKKNLSCFPFLFFKFMFCKISLLYGYEFWWKETVMITGVFKRKALSSPSAPLHCVPSVVSTTLFLLLAVSSSVTVMQCPEHQGWKQAAFSALLRALCSVHLKCSLFISEQYRVVIVNSGLFTPL